jgi:ribose transport system permease protein
MSVAPRTAESTTPLRGVQRALADRPVLVLIAILVLLLGATDIASPGFVSAHQLSTTLLNAAPLGVLAAGQTLVILTGGIDLSVTNTATAAAYIMALLGSQGTPLAVAVALGLGLLVGLINGIGIGIFGVQPLIMTLGMASVEIGGLTVISQTFNNGAPLVPEPVHQLGSGTILNYVPVNLLLWAPLSVLIILGLRRTGFGRMVYAVGDNPLACRLAGVRVWQVLLANYALCGLLSALGGILVVGFTNAADLGLATSFLLPSIAAVVIGGTSIVGGSGGYSGTIVGALILTVLDSLLNVMSVSQAVRQMIYGAIVLVLAWVYVRTAGGE